MSEPSKTSDTGVPETKEIVVGVRFQAVGKVYHFDANGHSDLRENDFVIVTTSRGQQLGQVASVGPRDKAEISGSLKSVDRRATGRDLAIRKHWENKELEALITARELNAQIRLPIKLIKAEYSFDGRHLTFLYNAEERKETKTLRQRLSRTLRARIEMRQIGPRDVAKTIGGYGACGGPRCCSTFLTEFSPISIRMAKAQGISLSPTEITGMCGRLRCCLLYEYEQYVEARKKLPKQSKRVGTPHGEGKVISLQPLKQTALIDLGDRRVEVDREDIVPLEEWRALQEKAAQKCDHDADCTCGRKAQETPQVEPKTSTPPPPASRQPEKPPQAKPETKRRGHPRRGRKQGQTKAQQQQKGQQSQEQQNPQGQADDEQKKSRSSRSSRHRRRPRRN